MPTKSWSGRTWSADPGNFSYNYDLVLVAPSEPMLLAYDVCTITDPLTDWRAPGIFAESFWMQIPRVRNDVAKVARRAPSEDEPILAEGRPVGLGRRKGRRTGLRTDRGRSRGRARWNGRPRVDPRFAASRRTGSGSNSSASGVFSVHLRGRWGRGGKHHAIRWFQSASVTAGLRGMTCPVDSILLGRVVKRGDGDNLLAPGTRGGLGHLSGCR